MSPRLLLLLPLPLPLALAVVLAAAPAAAQEGAPRAAELELVDGTTLRGEILAETDEVITFRVDGVTRAYVRKRIASVRSIAAEEVAAESSAERGDGEPRKKRDVKPLSSEAIAWLGVLVASLDTTDEQVRGSVSKAILALGPAVRGPLEKAATDASPAAGEAIQRILSHLTERAAGKSAKAARRPETAPDEAMEPGTPPALIADAGVRQAAERLRVELGLDEAASADVLEAVVEFRAGQVKLARAGERLAPEKLERRRAKLVTKAVKRLSDHLDPAATLLLRQRLATWQTRREPAARD